MKGMEIWKEWRIAQHQVSFKQSRNASEVSKSMFLFGASTCIQNAYLGYDIIGYLTEEPRHPLTGVSERVPNWYIIQLPWSSWGDISMKTKKGTYYTKGVYSRVLLSSSFFLSKLYQRFLWGMWRGALSLILYEKNSRFQKCWTEQSCFWWKNEEGT